MSPWLLLWIFANALAGIALGGLLIEIVPTECKNIRRYHLVWIGLYVLILPVGALMVAFLFGMISTLYYLKNLLYSGDRGHTEPTRLYKWLNGKPWDES